MDRRKVVCRVRPFLFRVVRYLPVARRGRPRATDLRAGVGQAPREETAGHAAVVRWTVGAYGDSGRSPRMRISMPRSTLPPEQPLVVSPA